MVRLVRHRQTKGAETDRPYLRPPRHTLTLPTPDMYSGPAQAGPRRVPHWAGPRFGLASLAEAGSFGRLPRVWFVHRSGGRDESRPDRRARRAGPSRKTLLRGGMEGVGHNGVSSDGAGMPERDTQNARLGTFLLQPARCVGSAQGAFGSLDPISPPAPGGRCRLRT